MNDLYYDDTKLTSEKKAQKEVKKLIEMGADKDFACSLTPQEAHDILKGILFLKEKHSTITRRS